MPLRFKPVAILPTLCTLGNTFCGFLAIAKVADALHDPSRFDLCVIEAATAILIAMVFDSLDGKIARMTNQASDFGAQMDSLTDLITFGVAPAFLAKAVYEQQMALTGHPVQSKMVLVVSFIYVACAALRLARFTIETDSDDESHEKFFGLPSPGAAGVVASAIFLIFEAGSPLVDVQPETRLHLVKTLLWALPLLGLLMVSRVEYVHVVSRWARGRRPFFHLLAILILLALVLTNHEVGFFACFGGYAVAGPFMALTERLTGRRIFAPDEDDDGPLASAGHTALVAMGSNLGDRTAHLDYALAELRKLDRTRVVKVSGYRETEPVGGPPQRAFLNAAVLLLTALEPAELLGKLIEIERRRGRERSVKDGPRVLDLDLVLYGGTICETPDLILPHPRFRERAFVLDPACEIAPDLVDPVTGKPLRRLQADLAAQKT